MHARVTSAALRGSLVALGLVLALGAPHADPPGGGAVPREITVVLHDYRFEPETVEVVAGRPVALTLVNRDWLTPHNLTVVGPGGGVAIDVDVSPGTATSITFTPQAPGSYTFYCDQKLLFFESHRDRGMEGRLVVRPAP